MEDLIKQAFLHVEVIGPHVNEGHYDLVGPNGDIILPQAWESVIEPDWMIIMHMWPIPETQNAADPPPDGKSGYLERTPAPASEDFDSDNSSDRSGPMILPSGYFDRSSLSPKKEIEEWGLPIKNSGW